MVASARANKLTRVVGLLMLMWPVPALLALVAQAFGRGAGLEGAHWLSGRLVLLLVGAGVLALLVTLSLRDPYGSSLVDVAAVGAVTLALAALPCVAFYSLGYTVRRRWLAGALWFAGTLPLAAYCGLAMLGLYSLSCGGDCAFVVD